MAIIIMCINFKILTFNFHSYNHYGNACYSLQVIIVVTKTLATILAMPGYS